jgi:tripartite ATP-independent transporter DctM subunit
MFLAGVVPGLLLALAFCAMIVAMVRFRPHLVLVSEGAPSLAAHETTGSALRKAVPIAALIVLVLGGLYAGFFTATEAGAVGAAGALAIALARRRLDGPRLWRVLVETGHITVSVLFLVLAASLYSRMLALTGLPGSIASSMTAWGLGPTGFLIAYVAIVVLLGCIIDSVSIMLIMLPIVLPIVREFGMDLIWFGVVTVVAVEIGLLTPPFGISVYTVKSALDDRSIGVRTIFAGAFPFVLCMMAVLAVLIAFPSLSTWLARM